MKKLLTLIILVGIVLAVIFVFKNNSPASQVRKLQKFTAQVEQEYMDYTQTDLDKALADYKVLSENIDESKLTDDDKKLVSRLRGECNGYFAKAKGRLVLDKLKDAGETVKGVINSFKKED